MPSTPVLASTMFHREIGTGKPIVFLHGNPTSSHLWRNILPAVDGGRRLAPDLIGMGRSGKPDIGYSFDDHSRYLDAWIDAVGLNEVVLIGHDWGGALAFDWAARHPDRVRGLVFLETIVKPMTWEEFPAGGRDLFRSIKTPDVGERMIVEQNIFLTQMLPASVATGLANEDLKEYLRPYPTPESRRPLLSWSRSMPLGGEPVEVVSRIERYDDWLASSPEVPKLLLAFEPGPGAMLGPELIDWCTRTIAGLDVDRLGPAGHHAPEDQPAAIAAAIRSWVNRHQLR
ncbi:haloalkane dehalogenase [Micromonospora arida]|uniref:haloalkane dehalogenase n=1 Tax=Micromonospora arida TaxID=2203715 RepID=UPI0033AF4793